MVIIGIDPGTAVTGFGIINCSQKRIKQINHGSIKTTNDKASSERLNLIYQELSALLQKHKPQALAVESLFFFANAKSVSAVGQAIGVIKLAAARKKIPVFEYPPLRIKMIITGNGRAEKKQIQSEVRKMLKLRKLPRPTHAADALAAAICHWQTQNGKIKKTPTSRQTGLQKGRKRR